MSVIGDLKMAIKSCTLRHLLAKHSYVYAAVCGDRAKIGFSSDLLHRSKRIQAHCSHTLEFVVLGYGGRKRERKLHHKYRRYRIHGEWFSVEGSLATRIEESRNASSPIVFTAVEAASYLEWKRRRQNQATYEGFTRLFAGILDYTGPWIEHYTLHQQPPNLYSGPIAIENLLIKIGETMLEFAATHGWGKRRMVWDAREALDQNYLGSKRDCINCYYEEKWKRRELKHKE